MPCRYRVHTHSATNVNKKKIRITQNLLFTITANARVNDELVRNEFILRLTLQIICNISHATVLEFRETTNFGILILKNILICITPSLLEHLLLLNF